MRRLNFNRIIFFIMSLLNFLQSLYRAVVKTHADKCKIFVIFINFTPRQNYPLAEKGGRRAKIIFRRFSPSNALQTKKIPL